MKNAVILAAGIGSRLSPLTGNRPKCLVKVAGRPLLEYQLAAYEKAGFEQVWIVAGFCAPLVREWLTQQAWGMRVDVIDNTEFDTTNNMYSLWQVRNRAAGEPFYLSNGDVVFDPEILEKLEQTNTGGSAIAVQRGMFNEESMKIRMDSGGRKINGIAKTFTEKEAEALSIDLYRFSATASESLFEIVRSYIGKGERHHWTEVALDALLRRPEHDFQAADVGRLPWMEIDTLSDLALADIDFCADRTRLAEARAFVFDIDGTLMLGGQILPGVREIVTRLQKDRRVFFCTNNSSRSGKEYMDILHQAGLACETGDILTSTGSALSYLKSRRVRRCLVVGTPALEAELENAGFTCNGPDPEIIVVGFDTTLTYGKIARASQLVAQGCPYILTHPDTACPTPNGPVPDAGAMGALLQATTGIAPKAVLGKPSHNMLASVFREGFAPEETVIVGDRLTTDICMAKTCGCLSVLTLSGITTRHDVDQSPFQPSLIVNSVANLGDALLPGELEEERMAG